MVHKIFSPGDKIVYNPEYMKTIWPNQPRRQNAAKGIFTINEIRTDGAGMLVIHGPPEQPRRYHTLIDETTGKSMNYPDIQPLFLVDDEPQVTEIPEEGE